jgi:hypothetical protein
MIILYYYDFVSLLFLYIHFTIYLVGQKKGVYFKD